MKKGFTGVNDYPEEKRAYPQGTVASQVVGLRRAPTTRASAGSRSSTTSSSRASRARQTVVRDPFGQRDRRRQRDAGAAGPRHLLDDRQQDPGERRRGAARDGRASGTRRSATAIVLDPHTGAVLAMAQAPGYNANNSSRGSPVAPAQPCRHGRLRARVGVQARDRCGRAHRGARDPASTFRLPPCIQVADKCIHDAELRGTETLTVAKILSYSSNVGAITIAEKLGAPELMKWIGKFGFGKPTGLDFPGESGGIVPSYPDQWSGTTIGNVPIGQGIAVTPIQIASAYAAIANGGVWIQPHLVEPRRRAHAAQLQAPADRLSRCRRGAEDDAHRRRRRARRNGQRGADRPGTRSPARPARRRSRARTATRRASTSPRSSAWCR